MLSHTLDALSILPLTSSHLSSHPSLLSTLTSLRSHTDESISQSADDLLTTLDRQRREGNDREEKDVDDANDQSRFRSIKIDKSTADVGGHGGEAAVKGEGGVGDVKVVAFDEGGLSPPRSPSEEKVQVKAEKGKQAQMEAMVDEGSAVLMGGGMVLGKRKRKGLSVSWQQEDRLESVRLFFKEEPIVKREKKISAGDARDGFAFSQSALPSTPLTPTLDWYTPAKLTLPPLLHTQLQSRGHLSTEKQTQLQRERSTLRSVYIPGQELPHNPTESPESLSSSAAASDAEVAVIPWEVAKYAPASEAAPAESRPSGAEFSSKTVELLSKLSSLALLIPSASAAPAVPAPQYPRRSSCHLLLVLLFVLAAVEPILRSGGLFCRSSLFLYRSSLLRWLCAAASSRCLSASAIACSFPSPCPCEQWLRSFIGHVQAAESVG